LRGVEEAGHVGHGGECTDPAPPGAKNGWRASVAPPDGYASLAVDEADDSPTDRFRQCGPCANEGGQFWGDVWFSQLQYAGFCAAGERRAVFAGDFAGCSTPAGCTQANPLETAEVQALPTSPSGGTERTGENPKGTAPMQIGCKPDANRPALDGIPSDLLRAWPQVPEHIRLTILSLVVPYLPRGEG
jgi:hypothetical protein